MTKQKSNHQLIKGLLLGGTIGTMIGLLFSPRQGKENRQIIQDSLEKLPELAEDLTYNLKFKTKSLSKTTIKKWDQTFERLQKAITAGILASQKEGQISDD